MFLDERVRFETDLSVDETVRALARHVRPWHDNVRPEGLSGSATRDRVVIQRHRGYMAWNAWFRFRGRVVGGRRTTLEGELGLSRFPILFLAAWLVAVLSIWVAVLVLRTSGRLVPGRETEATLMPLALLAVGLAILIGVIRAARTDAAYIKAQVEEILRGRA